MLAHARPLDRRALVERLARDRAGVADPDEGRRRGRRSRTQVDPDQSERDDDPPALTADEAAVVDSIERGGLSTDGLGAAAIED